MAILINLDIYCLQKGHSSEEELELSEDCEDRGDAKTASLRTPVCELGGHTGAISTAEWLLGKIDYYSF